MPILCFATREGDLHPASGALGRRTLIQVSDAARRRIVAMLGPQMRRCDDRHLEALRTLISERSFDAELALVLQAIARHGRVYVTFL